MTAAVNRFAPGGRVFVHANPDAPVALAGVRGVIVAVRGDYAIIAAASATETLEIALSHLCHDRDERHARPRGRALLAPKPKP
jgi:hypothetical protein